MTHVTHVTHTHTSTNIGAKMVKMRGDRVGSAAEIEVVRKVEARIFLH